MIMIPEDWLESALDGYGCPICHALSNLEFDFMIELQSDDENSIELNILKNQNISFCNYHFWHIHQMMNEKDEAPFLITSMKKIIESKKYIYHKACCICEFITENENKLILQFITKLQVNQIRNQYKNKDGVCLRHLHRILDSEHITDALKKYLKENEKNSMERLLPLLRGLCKKSYSSTSRIERGSVVRSIEKLVGKSGLP